MTHRPIRVVPAAALRDAFVAIRREAGVPEAFPAAVAAEADAAVRAAEAPLPRLDLPLRTIDPPGSRDLDQAMHIERRGAGHRVRYAIADVASFVTAGGALDAEAQRRGVTVYAPDAKSPLYPAALSEGAASLLPGQWVPAVLWTLDLDAAGELEHVEVARHEVRSVAQHTYEDAPDDLRDVLAEVGERRLARARARGAVQLAVPEQEVVEAQPGTWTVHYRVPLAVEQHNAQVSLLTGMAAASLMLGARVGILRTQPAPAPKAMARLRRQAQALGVAWPEPQPYADLIASLDPAVPAHAALLHEAAGIGRGAGYVAFDGRLPADAGHFAVGGPYAHATAPLRRLQDRYVSECCLAASAGTAVPDWVRAGLAALPAAMGAGARRAGTVERGVVDVVEAAVLQGREGECFEAVVIDDQLVQIAEPGVRGRLEDDGSIAPGRALTVRLVRADIAARTVAFAPR